MQPKKRDEKKGRRMGNFSKIFHIIEKVYTKSKSYN